MSLTDISLIRQIPIIDGMVIVPDRIPVTITQALTIPGITVTSNSLLIQIPEQSPARYVQTSPGVEACCDSPANNIANLECEQLKALSVINVYNNTVSTNTNNY